jgi:hypothetical protein
MTNQLPEPLKNFLLQVSTENVPERLEEATKDPKWVKAMETEMDAHEK